MKNFIEKLRNIDVVKALLATAAIAIVIIVVIFMNVAIHSVPKKPGRIQCYAVNGTKVWDVHSPDVIWNNTSGVTYRDQDWQRVEFSNENCMVTFDRQP